MAATDLRLATPRQPSPERGLRRRLLTHLPFALLLVAGVVLRALAWRTYRPALLFPDSRLYLLGAANEELQAIRPSGYSAFLWPFVNADLGGLSAITLART